MFISSFGLTFSSKQISPLSQGWLLKFYGLEYRTAVVVRLQWSGFSVLLGIGIFEVEGRDRRRQMPPYVELEIQGG